MRKYFELVLDLGSGNSSLVKIPLRTANRLMFSLGIVFIVSIVSTGGWLMSRWRLHQSSEDLGREKMKTDSLEARLRDIQSNASGLSVTPEASVFPKDVSATLYPSLDADEYQSPSVEIQDLKVEIFPSKKEAHLQFELTKKEAPQVAERFYALGLLHGAQGVLHLPPTLASRKSDPILFHRGLVLNDIRARRSVRQVFQVGDFLDRTVGEPVFFTLLIYDNKGTLVFKKRAEPIVRRVDGSRTSVNSISEKDTR